jgi:hypothetical protein
MTPLMTWAGDGDSLATSEPATDDGLAAATGAFATPILTAITWR